MPSSSPHQTEEVCISSGPPDTGGSWGRFLLSLNKYYAFHTDTPSLIYTFGHRKCIPANSLVKGRKNKPGLRIMLQSILASARSRLRSYSPHLTHLQVASKRQWKRFYLSTLPWRRYGLSKNIWFMYTGETVNCLSRSTVPFSLGDFS